VDSGTDYYEYSDLLGVLGRGALCCHVRGLALSIVANPRGYWHFDVLGFRSFTWRFRSVTLRSQSDGSKHAIRHQGFDHAKPRGPLRVAGGE